MHPRGLRCSSLNTPGILGRRALPAGRLARLGATSDFHHGLLPEDTPACEGIGSRSNTGRLGSTIVQQNAPTKNNTPMRYKGRFQLPNHCTEYATMSGLSIAARFPTEFIVAPTTPT